MILYRVSKLRHADDLSGKGAELSGGRWNKVGYPAIYLAENISLAILETIVHCQCINDLHNRLIVSVEVPEISIKTLDQASFPDNWNSIPWHTYTIENGTLWLESQETLLLKVPSSIVLKENIFILNPKHGGFKSVRIISKEIFKPDNRLVLLRT
ncbi:MAG: hypothetical protein A2176_15260 [Spirochaetes bacterium RBG_13_51_14]|nr:MAG: hypothetical protein A2176_15260 [Spirochaetes bacterium RBG_13_51_14]